MEPASIEVPMPLAVKENSVSKMAHELLTHAAFSMPPAEAFEAAVGFTEEQKAIKDMSFASLSEEDMPRYIPDAYVLEHLTGYGEGNICKYYRELEKDASINGIIQLLTKKEILENADLARSLCTSNKTHSGRLPDEILNAKHNKQFLFATRDGVIDLHMRASRQKGSLWRDCFRKAEKLKKLQKICTDMIDARARQAKPAPSESAIKIREIDDIPEMEHAPVVQDVSPLHKQMREYLVKTNYTPPSNNNLEKLVDFTDEDRQMREMSFASIEDGNKFRHIPEEYVLKHLTSLGEANIRKYYAELEQDGALIGLIKIYTRKELEAPDFTGSFSTDKIIFENVSHKRKYLFATREGIIDLHLRANKKIGAAWRSYFRKAELMMHMQGICLDMIRINQYEIQSKQDQLKMIEYTKQVEDIKKRAEYAEKLAEAERRNREASEKKAAQLRGLTKAQLKINYIDYFYIAATRRMLAEGYVKPGRASDPIARLKAYNTGTPDEYFYIFMCRASNAQDIENAVAAKFGAFRATKNRELLLCNIEDLIKFAHAYADCDKQGIDIANAHHINFIDNGLSEIDRVALFPRIDAAAYVAANPIVKVGKAVMRRTAVSPAPDSSAASPAEAASVAPAEAAPAQRKSRSRSAPAKPLDKMNDDDFKTRIIEIVDAEVVRVSGSHIINLPAGRSVDISWKILQKPIKRELSPEAKLLQVRSKIQPLFAEPTLSPIKCTFIEKTKK